MAISSSPHFVIFPFMSHGHTIPLLYLSRLLFNRNISVTIFTTPANYSSVRATLKNDSISVVDIPFPDNLPGVPPGIEIPDKLPSMSSFMQFVDSTIHLQTPFEQAVQNLDQPVSCIISDGFLSWTQDSADKMGIPRLVFYGINIFSMTMCNLMAEFKPHAAVSSDDEPFQIPVFPRFKMTVNDFEPPFSELEPKGPALDFIVRQHIANSRSHGMVVNNFYELESEFIDHWNRSQIPKAWCVGPLCLAKPPAPKQSVEKATWFHWLDSKLAMNEPVLYVSFGTQAEASLEQIREVATGLERSKVSFLWALKSKQSQFLEPGFEERVKGRGIVVKEWVDQFEILKHESVCGFLSHCGWNSVLEAIIAGVPVLAMPLLAEQHLNARAVVEEIGIGIRLWARGMVARGMVGAEEVEEKVKEVMVREVGKAVRERVKEVREGAINAMKQGGSSSRTLDSLIDHVCGKGVGSTI